MFPEHGSVAAMALLQQVQRGSLNLLAPDLFVAEVLSIAWKKCALKREITQQEAHEACTAVLAVAPRLVPSSLLWQQALAIGAVHRRSTYDCLYVALALSERCDLITADRTLVTALNPVFGCLRCLD
ncbi:MAG: type II toxin-antitoxin system VapC family toxin [Candidatus Wallbacteria bacterium]|nr:type II toxin-antitoxin system VapC family toxin [Candidatus Wallbacteria bacterium]